MGKVKGRYFWVKTNGSVQEVDWKKFRELQDKSLSHPAYNHRLVILEPNWIGFLQGIHYISFPRKALEHLFQEVK
jgi:hypothetical protein